MKKAIEFWKYDAAGNDFILFAREPLKSPAKNKSFVVRHCQSHSGIGADGIIFIWRDRKGDWVWRFFNNDGSEVALCGNACRAVAFWLSKEGSKKKKQFWKGSLGAFEGYCTGRNCEVTWPTSDKQIEEAPTSIQLQLSGYNDRGLAGIYWVKLGNPHLVLLNHEVWNAQDRFTANPLLRADPALGPDGANVTWLSLKNFETVTFERGVEKETLACGSGALAAYYAYNAFQESMKAKAPKKANFRFPGGTLSVSIKENRAWVSGPIRLVYRGYLGPTS